LPLCCESLVAAKKSIAENLDRPPIQLLHAAKKILLNSSEINQTHSTPTLLA
jgi:hypothetical protein